jgi:hypothetical protein
VLSGIIRPTPGAPESRHSKSKSGGNLSHNPDTAENGNSVYDISFTKGKYLKIVVDNGGHYANMLQTHHQR